MYVNESIIFCAIFKLFYIVLRNNCLYIMFWEISKIIIIIIIATIFNMIFWVITQVILNNNTPEATGQTTANFALIG